MIPRTARPGTTKVTGLTPDNSRALAAADKSDLAWDGFQMGASVAYWLVPPAQALRLVNDAIRKAQADGAARPLHAVRRKLEKQASVTAAGVEAKQQPKARKTRKPADCDHDDTAQIGDTARAKCLDCGLVIDAQPVTTRQRPARYGQGGTTTATVVPAVRKPPAPQNGTQPPLANTGDAISDALSLLTATTYLDALRGAYDALLAATAAARAANRPPGEVDLLLDMTREARRLEVTLTPARP